MTDLRQSVVSAMQPVRPIQFAGPPLESEPRAKRALTAFGIPEPAEEYAVRVTELVWRSRRARLAAFQAREKGDIRAAERQESASLKYLEQIRAAKNP